VPGDPITSLHFWKVGASTVGVRTRLARSMKGFLEMEMLALLSTIDKVSMAAIASADSSIILT
jgi:hypothetical protein